MDQKRVDYTLIHKKDLGDSVSRAIPDEFIPDAKRLGTIIGTLFLIAVLISFIQMGVSKTKDQDGIERTVLSNLLKGNVNQTLKVGYPLSFLEFNLIEPAKQPLKLNNLLITIILYMLLGYIIEIFLKFTKKNTKKIFEEDKGTRPKEYKIKQKTYADKVTEKVFKKN